MFQFLSVFNFQKHKAVHFDLARITTIIGPTGAGKTAIIRALRWLCLNKPQGRKQPDGRPMGAIRKGTKEAEVVLTVDDYKVTRRRGKGVNEYCLDDREFQAFGNSVPEPIQDVLNVDEVNFQRQLDAPFWITDSPAQVARSLNAIVDLEIVDQSLTSVSREHRAAQAELRVVRQRVASARAEVKGLGYVSEMKQVYGCLEKQYTLSASVLARAELLGTFIQSIASAAKTRHRASSEASAASVALRAGQDWSDTYSRARGLAELLTHIRLSREAVGRNRAEAAELESEFHALLDGQECPLCHQIVIVT